MNHHARWVVLTLFVSVIMAGPARSQEQDSKPDSSRGDSETATTVQRRGDVAKREFEFERPIIGADISFVPSQEDRGSKFSDQGEKADVLKILSDHKFNWIRLRLFVDPTAEKGYSRQGYCGLEQTLAMAKRIEKAGMNLLLDFHYSDTWADPGKQFTPSAWKGLSDEELSDKLYEYTSSVIRRLKVEGVAPEMVQIGNEIHNGFLWPQGQIKKSKDTFGALLKRASEAVRDADPKIPIMVHPALGGDNGRSVRFFDLVLSHGVVFDVIGQSYYPDHHGTLEQLENNLTDLAKRYHKPIVVVEYKEHAKEVNEIVRDLPNNLGLGTFIWEATSSRWGGLFDRDGSTTKKIDIYPEFFSNFTSTKSGEADTAEASEPNQDDEASTLKVIRDIAYRDGPSKAWRLDLAMPAEQTETLRPALVIVHGGGWRGGSKSVDVYQKMMTDYAEKGYVTINVEYRLTGEAPFPACIEDVKCAVRWLRAHAKKYHVDPDRIGAYGHSAGAHLALMLAMAPKSAGLEGDGDWKEYSSIVNVSAAGSPPTELGRDVPMAKPQWWPIGYISDDHPPLFLIQGSEDRIVQAKLTDDFVKKMKAAGADIEYLRIDGARHGLAYNEKLDVTDPAIEKFFAKHLKPTPPGKAASVKSSKPTAVIIEDGGTGPYSAIVTEDVSLPGMTIFRPRDLSPFGESQKLPILLWGNGACANTTEEHKNFLNEIASQGYVVLAIGLLDQIETRDETSRRRTQSKQLVNALDWIIAENERNDSKYFGKVNAGKVAAMGMSCGGLQAIEISLDPRISTTVVCNSGVLPEPSPLPGMPALKKDILQKLHAPVLYIMGGPSDIAYKNAMDDFSRINHLPIVMTNFDVGHAGTYARPHGGEFTPVSLAWLDWQLKGKSETSKMFLGDDSTLAKDPKWTVETKNFQTQKSKASNNSPADVTALAAYPPAIPNGWSEGYVYANGVRLHYYRAVPAADKLPLVMVHGITDNGLCWTTLALKLQDDYDIYMLDARGHGLSDPFTASDDTDTLITDVVAAVQALELKKPILMGHSMGAHTVMRLGAEYPELTKAVIMLDPLLEGARNGGGQRGRGQRSTDGDTRRSGEGNGEEGDAESGGQRNAPPTNDRRGDSPEPKRLTVSMFGSPEDLVAQNNYPFDELVAKCRRDSPKWDLVDCQYWALSKKQYHGAYSREQFAVMSGAMRIGDSLKKISVPSLILKADASPDDRKAHQESASAMKNGKLVHIDDAGHNLHHDQLSHTFEVLSQFLSTLSE